MSIRIERRLQADAETSLRRFCRLADLPRWVPSVEAVEVEQVRSDGLPQSARFVLAKKEDEPREYVLEYEYDLSRHLVGWTPRAGHDLAVAGYVVFHPVDGLRCRMTYVLEHGAHRGDDLATLQAEAERAADGFVVYIARG